MPQKEKKSLKEDLNKKIKDDLKKAFKDAVAAIEDNSKDLKEKIKLVQKKLDKAAKKNIFHKNKASRKLKRLVKSIAIHLN